MKRWVHHSYLKVAIALVCVVVFILYIMTPKTIDSISGYVERREVPLSFLVTGRVDEIFVDEGQTVTGGQILATVEPTLYIDRCQQMRANYELAQSQYEYALKEFNRQALLSQTQTNSQQNYDQALAQYHQAQASLLAAESVWSQSEYELKQTQLYAPNSGVPTRRLAELGSVCSPGVPVFTLCLDAPVWIRAYATLKQLDALAPGSLVEISTDMGRKYTGSVGYISPQAEFTPKTVQTNDLRPLLVYRLRIVVSNPDSALRQGLPVQITPKNV